MFIIGNDFEEDIFECMKEGIVCFRAHELNVFGNDRKDETAIDKSEEIFDEECNTHHVVETSRITLNKESVE
jgi:hypothetical protein